MGDIVFTPLYEVLLQRGVKFEFFHKLTNVGIARDTDGSRYVKTLKFDVQAKLNAGATYQPLVDVHGVPSWPATPLWDQLVDGTTLEERQVDFESAWDHTRTGDLKLRVSHDFDLVVLGVSLGAIPMVCSEILAVDQRWRDMVSHVKTVATQVFQLWLKVDLEQLGWAEEPPNLSAFVEPFDTWADMTHIAPQEEWPVTPATLAYFCNVYPLKTAGKKSLRKAGYPNKHNRRVRKNAIRFLNKDMQALWPDAVRNGEFRWNTLAYTAKTEHLFNTQYWKANVNPTDRYVQSLPGTSQYRISPLDDTYDNLTITGDWTNNGFNMGCVEAAVMSGKLAAHALSNFPALKDIYNYDHP